MALFGVAIGMIVLVVGVALLYMLPDYIISTINNTGTFTAAQVVAAQAKADQVRGLGFLVIIIATIWIAISVMAGGGKASGG